MRRLALLVAAVGFVGLFASARFITEPEAIVSGALTSLKFESLPPPRGLVGAPPKFRVTRATLDYLDSLIKAGKLIEVQGDGSIKILDSKK